MLRGMTRTAPSSVDTADLIFQESVFVTWLELRKLLLVLISRLEELRRWW